MHRYLRERFSRIFRDITLDFQSQLETPVFCITGVLWWRGYFVVISQVYNVLVYFCVELSTQRTGGWRRRYPRDHVVFAHHVIM